MGRTSHNQGYTPFFVLNKNISFFVSDCLVVVLLFSLLCARNKFTVPCLEQLSIDDGVVCCLSVVFFLFTINKVSVVLFLNRCLFVSFLLNLCEMAEIATKFPPQTYCSSFFLNSLPEVSVRTFFILCLC